MSTSSTFGGGIGYRAARLPGGDPILKFRGSGLCSGLATLLVAAVVAAVSFGVAGGVAGCGGMGGAKPPPAATGEKPPPPKPTVKVRPRVPSDKDCGPEMSLKVWKVQCADEHLAMMCRKSDPTDRRCARQRGGRYRWTYGSYCHRSLPCYKRACN